MLSLFFFLEKHHQDPSAFGQKKNESQVEEDEQDSDRESENPYMDDLDIAKEIYRSKGTTIPPTNHVFSRTLNTIPEDDIPTEVNIVETASNSNTDSTKSSPTKKALKFEDPFDENIFSSSTGDTFEWDDYIGDELVGKVNDEEFQDSPRQSMDFPDWTLDMDASSNSGTESLNHSKAGSEASDSRPGSRTSNRLSTSESEDSDGDQDADLSTSTLQNTVTEGESTLVEDDPDSKQSVSDTLDCTAGTGKSLEKDAAVAADKEEEGSLP